MQRRELLVLAATAGAATIAGCLGGTDGDGGSGGASSNSTIDGQSLAQSHQEGLAAAGTYSLTFAIRMENTGSEPLTQTIELSVDESSERYLDTHYDSLGVGRSQRFVEADRVYSFSNGGVTNTESYDVAVLDDDTRRKLLFPRDMVIGWVETVTDRTQFREIGTESFDEIGVTRYEAEGDSVVERAVDEVRYVLLVDGNGIVRYFERHTEDATGNGDEQRLVTHSWQFSDIGTTTVVEPDWVGDLR